MKKLANGAKGHTFYGMHFYPGVARYAPPDKEAFTVFINEDTIRKMGPTFAGCPVYVEHVDGVDENINEVRKDADGWVEESFFNAADGKHWVKFLIVSDRGLAAIQRGYRLSNAYVPEVIDMHAVWNGVDYSGEVVGGEFEHLAIVKDPRYEESIVMTPEEFKVYNESKKIDLERFKNSKEKSKMAFKFFNITRKKVENSKEIDLESLVVELPECKKEMSLTDVIKGYDKVLNMQGYASDDHMVKLNDKEEMSVKDLRDCHNKMMEEKAAGEKAENDADEGGDDEGMENEALDIDQNGDVGARGGDESLGNEEDEKDEEKDKKDKKDKMKNAAEKKKEIKEKAERVRKAHLNAQEQEDAVVIDLPMDQVARGISRYGSGK